VALKDGHKPTASYVKKLREVLPAAFPEDTFYFQAADIVTQILNFGLPAQIDVRTVGYDKNNLSVAKELRQRLAAIPGIVDAHLQQEVDAPAFYAQIDRTRAAQLGLNASTVATNINVSLSSSEQVSPNFWTDPTSGIPYYLAVQTPERKVNSLNALANTPVSRSTNRCIGTFTAPVMCPFFRPSGSGSVPAKDAADRASTNAWSAAVTRCGPSGRSSAIRSRRGGVGHGEHSDLDSEGADQQPQVQQRGTADQHQLAMPGTVTGGLGQPGAAFAPVTGNGNSRWIQVHPRQNSSRARR